MKAYGAAAIHVYSTWLYAIALFSGSPPFAVILNFELTHSEFKGHAIITHKGWSLGTRLVVCSGLG